MMHEDDSSVRAQLLSELRGDTAVDAGALVRVRERVAVSLTAAHLAAIGAPVPSVERERSVSTSRRSKASLSGLVLALAAGTALGAGGHALVSARSDEAAREHPALAVPDTRRQTRSPKSSSVPIAPTHPADSAMPAPVPLTPAPHVERVATPIAASTAAESGLGRELAELDRARSAITRGQSSEGLAILQEHSKRFPNSKLSQERDALTVKALVGSGRHAEARAAGERFRARYPDGLLLDAVTTALSAIP